MTTTVAETRARRTVRVEVTAEDIERGQRCESDACPIALALRRAGFDGAAVDGAGPFDDGKNGWTKPELELPSDDPEGRPRTVALPSECGDFARAFDRQDAVEPFAFDLEIP